MSNSLAIAAVTTTLRNLLQRGFDADEVNVKVTTRPPDKMQAAANVHQVNLFLYHTAVDPQWRNMDTPWRLRPGETGPTPLPLCLYYLVTVYYGDLEEAVDTDTNSNRLAGSHRLLGRAMSILHDRPLLDTATINSHIPAADRVAHPYDQVENVRVTPQPLSLDELSKLWTGFQTQYRPSAAYEVRVVLIESGLPARTPLPVLKRGPEDRGVEGQAALLPPFPTLDEIRFAGGQPAARLGETITLLGHHLAAGSAVVRFAHRRLPVSNEIPIAAATPGDQVAVALPDAPGAWPAGLYDVDVVLTRSGEQERTTNALAMALAPRLTPPSGPVSRDGSAVTLTCDCVPQVHAGQVVFLLFGDRQVAPASMAPIVEPPPELPPDPTLPTTLTCTVQDVEPGEYWLRLRVDGVDSLLVDRSTTPPRFDAGQKVTIQ